MDYAKAIKKMKKQELTPRASLWNRIEDTLVSQPVTTAWSHKLAFSATALAFCVMLTFGGINRYENYRLEQYLVNTFNNPIHIEYFDFGTFI